MVVKQGELWGLTLAMMGEVQDVLCPVLSCRDVGGCLLQLCLLLSLGGALEVLRQGGGLREGAMSILTAVLPWGF